jgi:RNA polymerase sigma factor (sigma-70 family)
MELARMVHSASGTIGQQIETLWGGGSVACLVDRQLLERFVARRDFAGEAAFAALVSRHGPMVLDICRHVVGDQHLAEDAFQAVFLVLARKAQAIRNPDLLSQWLYGVALRTARNARLRLARRRRLEGCPFAERKATMRLRRAGRRTVEEGDSMKHPGATASSVASVEQTVLAREQIGALYNEIDRLPVPFRLPIVLCYFEGLTLDEAARRLSVPDGTVRSRLARAREKLRRALTRRGFGVTGTALAAGLSARSASAQVSSQLCTKATEAAIQFAAVQAGGKAVSASVTALAQRVLRSMLLHKLKLMAITVLVLATAAGSLGRALAMKQEPKDAQAAIPQPVVSKPANQEPQPASGRMFIVGRVLDAEGKPVADASVMAYAAGPLPGRREGMQPEPIGHGQSDRSGSFRLEAPRTSAKNDRFGAVATAPGFGAGWVELNPEAESPSGDISLRPEQLIEIRLFDVKGRPAQGMTVSVSSIFHVLKPRGDRTQKWAEGPFFGWTDTNDFPAWPKPIAAAADGQFILRGVGRGLRVSLTVRSERYALQQVEFDTDQAPGPKRVTAALEPAQIITGRVTYADTSKPAIRASISVRADRQGLGRFTNTSIGTDAEGRFRVNPPPGDRFVVYVTAPRGEPYLGVLKSFDWPKGAVEHSVDLALSRGALIRGKVTEQDSGKSIAGAMVHWQDHRTPGVPSETTNTSWTPQTAADGSYELVAVPGPGHLAIKAPGDDYVLVDIRERQFFYGQTGGRRFYSNAFIACEPKQGGPDLEVNVELRRGTTVSGKVISPDGQPVHDTWMFSRVLVRQGRSVRMPWSGDDHSVSRDGRFEIHGIDPRAEIPVFFLHPQRKLGATAYFSGKSASSGAVTVRLEPCGVVHARLVDPGGKPVAGFTAPRLIVMIVTPGASFVPKGAKEFPLQADQAVPEQIDPINHEGPPTSDAEGRVTFTALIPDATYRIIDRTPFQSPQGPQVRKEFSVKPGETLELGDILIEKRPAGR